MGRPECSTRLKVEDCVALPVSAVTGLEHMGGDHEQEIRGTVAGKPVRLRLKLVRGRRITGRLETATEREEAIRFELAEARRELEERTPHAVIHLCYPWHAGGRTARRIARETGYRTAFCGKVPGVPITRPGGDLERIARIGEDYVELLPGHGRQRLTSVLARKWSRRFRGRS